MASETRAAPLATAIATHADGSRASPRCAVHARVASKASGAVSAIGTFESSRFATGRKNYNRIEINGSRGSLVYNVERMNELEYYSSDDPAEAHGFRLIQATEGEHPFAGNYWPVGHIIGYEHTFINLVVDALRAMAEGREPSPNMEDGYQNQRVLDAVERSHVSRTWEKL